jgi:hypothetical protein
MIVVTIPAACVQGPANVANISILASGVLHKPGRRPQLLHHFGIGKEPPGFHLADRLHDLAGRFTLHHVARGAGAKRAFEVAERVVL